MDPETLQIFLDEAEGYLPAMRAGIMAYEHDPSLLAELQSVRCQAHTLKGSALMIDLPEIGGLAKELEGELKKIIQSKSALGEQAASEFLSQILVLEAHLKNLRTKLENRAAALGSNQPAEEIFPPAAEEEEEEEEAEEFEIDAEMLAVFGEEAEDLLRNITDHLSVLEKTPGDRDALLEIRRSAHTLKGSAGIIGLKNLSALAHRVEDLLDYLAEHEIEVDSQIFALLLTATDCLSALADGGENFAELNQKTRWLYETCDDVLAQMKAKRESSPASAAAAAANVKLIARDEIITEALPENELLIIPGDEDDDAPKHEVAVEGRAPETANQPLQRAVIRVSLDRIGELSNLVGEMVISRSIFEQRLGELERQIEELHNATRRLRSSADKIETDFESVAPLAGGTFAGGMPSQASAFHPSSSSPIKDSSRPDSKTDGGGEFDALEFDRYTEFHQTTRELIETASDASAINADLDNALDNLRLLFDNQKYLIEEMQENLLRLRMVALGTLAPRLQRIVRVTAQEEGKPADLVIDNDQLEIDTEILDAFVEPLIHLLRNAVAHGIEPAETRRLLGKPPKGKITLRAYSEGTHVVFTVADDGRGIDLSALKNKAVQTGFVSPKEAALMTDEAAYSLVFLPGLSTAAQINQVSGRGVGMNIVNSAVTRRHGTISVKSEPRQGTVFTVRLPVSMAVTRALLVKAESQTLAFPLKLVRQSAEISREDFERARREGTLLVGGVEHTFYHFNELVNSPVTVANQSKGMVPIVLLETLDAPCALAIEKILKTEEIVIKPLAAPLGNLPEVTGATVLGDGSVVPVLDLVYLLKAKEAEKGRRGEGGKNVSIPAHDSSLPPSPPPSPPHTLSVLIVDDSPSVRRVNTNLIKNAGWEAIAARDGLEALEILQAMTERLPDVVLTDVEMPRMDGYELLASLKREPSFSQIPVIMITSRAGEKHGRKAFDLGVGEYLTKPYEERSLLEKIKNLTV